MFVSIANTTIIGIAGVSVVVTRLIFIVMFVIVISAIILFAVW